MAPTGTPVVTVEPTPAVVDNHVAEVSDQLASARIAARKLAVRRQKAPYWVLASMLVLLVIVGGALAVGYASGWIQIGLLPAVAKLDPESSVVPPLEPAAGDTAAEGSPQIAETSRAEDEPKRSGPALDEPTLETSRRAKSKTEPTSDTTPIKLAETPVDPAQAARLRAELVAARNALGARNAQMAKERIAAAEKLAASHEQKDLVAGFQTLTKYVDGFWDAVGAGVQGLQEASELKVGNTIVSVVEVTAQRLTIRTNGQNRQYPLMELPAGIAVAIAKKWFDDRPDNKVYLGAFYFVDPRTDVAEAKRLWEEAASAGVDVKQLQAILSIAEN